ncbi:MAG: M3 family oligoendopeptidase [Clostridia bacterium]|nr:M3 family oligoendopeptidase [Clostridia bacterium]
MEKFSQLKYVRPDMEALRAELEKCAAAMEGAESYAQLREAYMEVEELRRNAFTMGSLARIRHTLDTTDEFYANETLSISRAFAQLMPVNKRINRAILNSPFRGDMSAEFGPILIARLEADERMNDERLIPLTIEQSELTQAYSRAAAACQTEFMGEKCNFYGLLKHMQNPDRDIRKRAFEAWANLYDSVSADLDKQYDRLVELRVQMAQMLGMDNYTQLGYLRMNRFDYGPEEVAKFRKQVLEVVTPAVAELRRRQAKRIGVDKVKFYDETFMFADGNAAPIGGKDVLLPIAARMYHEMSPETGEFIDFMVDHELFDLDTRPGKHLGGYCSQLAAYKAPFIFSNFNGTSGDVDVLTHEAGHAFEGYTATRCLPISALQHSTSEINEIHSMAMEHFAYPWMKDFYGEENVAKAKYAHLADALSVMPYMMCVDEFQHRVYANPTMSATERRHTWRELEKLYMPWRDYDGNEFCEGGGFWMQKQHIFLYPFYYIDYALAQTCAFELYGRMKTDKDAAWQDYLRLCRAGGSKGYFELLKVARLSNPFEEGSVERAVRHVIDELATYGF